MAKGQQKSFHRKVTKETKMLPLRHTEAIRFVDSIHDLIVDQSNWSQATFGSDTARGPVGALRHLQKEADEAIASGQNGEYDVIEFADIFLLLLDSSRRAGFTFQELLSAAISKHAINKQRKWPKPTDSVTPIEHLTNEGLI